MKFHLVILMSVIAVKWKEEERKEKDIFIQ